MTKLNNNTNYSKRNPIIALSLSLRFAKEYLEELKQMQKNYTIDEIQESKKLTIIQRALWTSLIIEIGRIFDTYQNKDIISFKKINLPEEKNIINNIHGEAIIGKIINTRKTFTAHWGTEKNNVVSVAELCKSNLDILLNKLYKPLATFEKWFNNNSEI
ncbi:hypothetical protein KKH38_02375 [Patescibacteria group bacterium]|nr:hypothetical protein [Patescibacteria group bacterium]MCG2700490.1 hypothetical protein [Candidatus Parcubacteria bacterium]